MVTWRSTDREWSLRILAEYREMPGLRLTLRQAARLWALDTVNCQAILDALVAAGSLRRSPKGEYCLPCDEEAAGHRVRSLVVRVTDVNGPRGGVDKRCRVTVQLQGPSRTVVIDDVMRMPPLPWTVQPTAPRAPSHEPSRPHPGGELFSAPDRVLWRVVRRGRVSQRKGLSL